MNKEAELNSVLHSVRLVTGTGEIDLDNPDPVYIGISFNSNKFLPPASIIVSQEYMSEDRLMFESDDILQAYFIENDRETYTDSSFTCKMKPRTAARILSTNRRAMKFINIEGSDEPVEGRHRVRLSSGEYEDVDDEELEAAGEIFDKIGNPKNMTRKSKIKKLQKDGYHVVRETYDGLDGTLKMRFYPAIGSRMFTQDGVFDTIDDVWDYLIQEHPVLVKNNNPRVMMNLDLEFDDDDDEDEEYYGPSVESRNLLNNPSRSTVSIWFDKDRFTKSQAKSWIKKHPGFKASNAYDSDGFHAFPQMSEAMEHRYKGKILSKYIKPGILLRFVPVRYMKKR